MGVSLIPAVNAVQLTDTDGDIANIGAGGGLDVAVQDQHSQSFDIYFSQTIDSPTTLAVEGAIDAYSITATTGHGILVGEQLVMYDSVSARLYIGVALAVATDVITLDTPLNFTYPIATTVIARSTKDLNVNGSGTRQTFSISPPINRKVDITRIIFQMTTDGAAAFEDFGDINGGLGRGFLMRSVNGVTTNYFNVKTNGDFSNLMYDVTTFNPSNPSGVYGISGRMTWGGQSKHGVVIRLEEGDSLEVIVQDDLTDLLTFRMIACGHIVEDN